MPAEQREICMQAVIYYEQAHNIPENQRVGFIDRSRSDGSTCGPDDGVDTIRILS